MTTRTSILSGTVVVAVGVVWYLFRPEALIVNKRVNEPFPAVAHAMSSMADAPAMAQSTGAHALASMADSAAMAQPATMADHPATEQSAIDAADSTKLSRGTKLSSGRFHTNAHQTSGLATIYLLPDGRRVLRLTQFATSNGPDVRVYLVAARDVQAEAAAKQAGFVDLGALKGNIGDQNYNIPLDLDLAKYQAVSIWCRRFSVNFGAAPLVEAT
jgi:electron transfer DM13